MLLLLLRGPCWHQVSINYAWSDEPGEPGNCDAHYGALRWTSPSIELIQKPKFVAAQVLQQTIGD